MAASMTSTQNVRTENGVVFGDLPQVVDFGYVAEDARVNAVALASLAKAPAARRTPGFGRGVRKFDSPAHRLCWIATRCVGVSLAGVLLEV
jgi:hypothetical protein